MQEMDSVPVPWTLVPVLALAAFLAVGLLARQPTAAEALDDDECGTS